jgi:hypothetical protein
MSIRLSLNEEDFLLLTRSERDGIEASLALSFAEMASYHLRHYWTAHALDTTRKRSRKVKVAGVRIG